MQEIKRRSPVEFKETPLNNKTENNWDVVLKYNAEGPGPHVIDLSHKTRLDLQTSNLIDKKPFGINIPENPGQSVFEKGILVNRMNPTQASLYHIQNSSFEAPTEPEYTDVTENTLCIALTGGMSIFSICEKLSALDFMDPEKTSPFLYQGPFSHVPCQIVTLERKEKQGIILTCSRGYGNDMIHSLLSAGEEFGLRPAGQVKFLEWLNNVNTD